MNPAPRQGICSAHSPDIALFANEQNGRKNRAHGDRRGVVVSPCKVSGDLISLILPVVLASDLPVVGTMSSGIVIIN